MFYTLHRLNQPCMADEPEDEFLVLLRLFMSIFPKNSLFLLPPRNFFRESGCKGTTFYQTTSKQQWFISNI